MNDIPNVILDIVGNCECEEISIGCSDSKVYKFSNEKNQMYLKVAKAGLLKKEFSALKWLQDRLPVSKLLCYESNDYDYLLTEGLVGEMVCTDYYISNPLLAIDLIVEGFNKILSVDIKDCPFDVGIDYKLDLVSKNVSEGLITGEYISEDILIKYNGVEGILNYLIENKFICEPCFSHGDTSLPNLFASGNKFTGFIDVGECGVADKWFDLAICEKSIIRNYGKEYIDLFYDKLSIKPDREKIDYYLLMMNLYL